MCSQIIVLHQIKWCSTTNQTVQILNPTGLCVIMWLCKIRTYRICNTIPNSENILHGVVPWLVLDLDLKLDPQQK